MEDEFKCGEFPHFDKAIMGDGDEFGRFAIFERVGVGDDFGDFRSAVCVDGLLAGSERVHPIM